MKGQEEKRKGTITRGERKEGRKSRKGGDVEGVKEK